MEYCNNISQYYTFYVIFDAAQTIKKKWPTPIFWTIAYKYVYLKSIK